MLNFFTRTIDDIHFLFNERDDNSSKGKKRKQRAMFALAGFGLVFIQLVFMLLFMFRLLHLDLIPTKYLIMLVVVLILVLAYCFLSQFTKSHIFGKILSVLMSALLLFGFIVGNQLNSTFNKITNNTIQTDVVTFLVLSESKSESIEDIFPSTIGYNSDIEGTVITNALSSLQSEHNVHLKSKEYTDWTMLVEALYANKDIQVLAVTDSMYVSLCEQFDDFSTRTRSVGTVKIETKVKVEESVVNKDVDSEPFIMYVSGSDTYGSIADKGRSDVNIIAVINPKTRQVLLVSTPRDYYINITNSSGKSGLDKLTHAGNYGTHNSISVLENLYNIDIDYYFKLNFTGCINIIDALGGITINSEREFTNGLDAAPIRYNFVKGANECDGAKALAFIRERQTFKDGDLQRGRNQQAAISAIIDKATSPAILTNYSAVLDAASSMMMTNMPTSNITTLIKAQISDMRSWNVQSYSAGTSGIAYRDGYISGLRNMSVVLPDDNSVKVAKQLIDKVYNGEVFNVDEYVGSLPYVKPTAANDIIPTPQTSAQKQTETMQASTEPVTEASTENITETASSAAATQASTENTTVVPTQTNAAAKPTKPTETQTKPVATKPTATKPAASESTSASKPSETKGTAAAQNSNISSTGN